MSYINVNTGSYPLSAREVRALFPNTSFPDNVADFELCISRLGFEKVITTPQHLHDYTKTVTEGAPTLGPGGYEQTWVVTDATPVEIADRVINKEAAVRQERNELLAASDWTQLTDSPVTNKAEWAQYRETLRDITRTAEFPWSVVWPTPPTV